MHPVPSRSCGTRDPTDLRGKCGKQRHLLRCIRVGVQDCLLTIHRRMRNCFGQQRPLRASLEPKLPTLYPDAIPCPQNAVAMNATLPRGKSIAPDVCNDEGVIATHTEQRELYHTALSDGKRGILEIWMLWRDTWPGGEYLSVELPAPTRDDVARAPSPLLQGRGGLATSSRYGAPVCEISP